MFSESAEFYDLIYSGFKNYKAECEKLSEVAARVAPGAKTALDVACGTGEHAGILSSEWGINVDGLDIEPGLLEVARQKNPNLRFFLGDMSSFHLASKYDLILCLFSSIGYAKTLDRVTAVLMCFKEHLNPDGRVILEPWFAPDEWRIGTVNVTDGKSEGLEVVRMSHSSAQGRISVVTFDYLIGTADGVEHRREVHELGMFTQDEMESCFEEAGLSAEYDPVGITGRGLYVAGLVGTSATGA